MFRENPVPELPGQEGVQNGPKSDPSKYLEIAWSYNHIRCFLFLVSMLRLVWTTLRQKTHAEKPPASDVTSPKVPKIAREKTFWDISQNVVISALSSSELSYGGYDSPKR